MKTFVLEGTEQLKANLSKIDTKLRTEASIKAVSAGAFQIMNRARINAPVKTGALRNSMMVTPRMNGSTAEAEISVNVVYARIQEYGGHAGRHGSVYIEGKHYLENALHSEAPGAVRAMSAVIEGYLK